MGQTLPVCKSDDDGTTWQQLTDLKATASLSGDAKYAKYTGNWTNPYLFVLPQDVGNIIAAGGWQGGPISNANTSAQSDPVWEPYLVARNGKLVAYYSDEHDYLGFDSATGVPTRDPADNTAMDARNQILVHKTWDGGTTSSWGQPIVDAPGTTENLGGKTLIGNGRPGMTTISETTDGKWLLTTSTGAAERTRDTGSRTTR